MKRKTDVLAVMVMFIVGGSCSVALAADISPNGPPFVTTVNTLGRTLTQEAGNWSTAQANADASVIVWDIEPAVFNAGDRLVSIIMHSTLPNSPISKRVWFDHAVTFTRTITDSPDQATSGTKALGYKPNAGVEAVIRLTAMSGEDDDIFGIGFMVTRLAVDVSVSVYDDADNLLFADVVHPNGNGFSWFGYQGDTDIAKVVLISSDTWQYWLDDVAITTTSGCPMTAGIINGNCRDMQEEAGNYSIGEFNANPDLLLFDIEDADDFPPNVTLTTPVCQPLSDGSGDVCVIFGGIVGAGYGPIPSVSADLASSGDHVLVYKNSSDPEITIDLNMSVNGVGLVLSRVQTDTDTFTVTFLDGSDVEVASFTLDDHKSGSSVFSFAGYYDEGVLIRKVVLDIPLPATGGVQWHLDDFAVISSASPCEVDPLAGDVNTDCIVDELDLATIVGNWLNCNSSSSGCP